MAIFEKFTDRARQAIVLAQEEARMLGHERIGTEHILLGLIHAWEGAAARTLDSFGLTAGEVRLRVEGVIGEGQQEPAGTIPFTSEAKRTS